MAKVEIKVQAPLKAVKEAFKKTETTKTMHESILSFVIERIKAFARTGFSMQGGKKRKLPDLSDSYKEFKKGESFYFQKDGVVRRVPKRSYKLNEVDPAYFRPSSQRSNLTFTGKLLNALIGTINQNQLTVEFNNDKRSGETNTNKEIYRYLIEKNPEYRVLDLDDVGKSRVKNIVITELRKHLGLVFKIR